MSEPDGKVVIKYTGDTSGIDKANNDAESKTRSFGSRIGSIAKGIGTAIAGMFVAAAAAVGALAKKGIELASDLAEVQNVVDVVFGDGADTIDAWSKTAQKAFGLSELEAKQYTGTMGAMLKSMGLTNDQVLMMSKDLAGLAGDFASFYNLDHDEAWEKIRSGISGETEPLKQLGINMSETNLQAFALSEGITTAYSAMTEAEKATLRYNYLLSVTADAQGDFARTADSWANQLRTASTNIDMLAASLGEKLLPNLTPVLEAFNDNAVPKLTEAFNKLSESGVLDEMGESLGQLATVLGDMIADILPEFIELLNEVLGPLADIAEAIDFKQILNDIMPILKELVGSIFPELAKIVETLFPPLQKAADKIFGALLEALETLNPAINSLIDNILPPLASILDTIGELVGIILDALGPINEILAPIIELLGKVLGPILGLIADALSIIVGLIGLIIEGIKWLLGQETNFDTYTNMITKPFTSQGAFVSALDMSVNGSSDPADYRSPTTPTSTFDRSGISDSASAEYVRLSNTPRSQLSDSDLSLLMDLETMYAYVPDDQLTIEEWYAKYMVPHNAKGTVSWKGGFTWVGEKGPELVDIPTGARIYPEDVSAAMVSGPRLSRVETTNISIDKVYPDEPTYLKLLKWLDVNESARQNTRSGGQ